MSKLLNLDDRLRLPYSIATGIPKGGDAEIEGYLQSLRVQGFCVVERVIPEGEVSTVRESVYRGRRLLQQDREAERSKRIELERRRNPDFQPGSGPVRSPMAPHAELCDIARNETFAEHLVEPRVLRVAKAMLDTHVRILQTQVTASAKSSKPTGRRSPRSNCCVAAGIPTGRMIWLRTGRAVRSGILPARSPSHSPMSAWRCPRSATSVRRM